MKDLSNPGFLNSSQRNSKKQTQDTNENASLTSFAPNLNKKSIENKTKYVSVFLVSHGSAKS